MSRIQRPHDFLKEIKSPHMDDPDYLPQDDGYVAFLECGDVDHELDDLEMPWRMSRAPFEDVNAVVGCSHAMYLPKHLFALCILMTNAD